MCDLPFSMCGLRFAMSDCDVAAMGLPFGEVPGPSTEASLRLTLIRKNVSRHNSLANKTRFVAPLDHLSKGGLPMQPTRIKTDDLQVAVTTALKKIDEAMALLAPYLVLITDNERAATPRTREAFPEASGALGRAIADHPKIADAADYNGAAVQEDLDNAVVLAPLAEKLTEFTQRVADSRLVWLAEAYVPSLTAYRVAKAVAKTNAALRTVIAPLAAIFATRRGKQTNEEPPTGNGP
jgi:hypothetical protein